MTLDTFTERLAARRYDAKQVMADMVADFKRLSESRRKPRRLLAAARLGQAQKIQVQSRLAGQTVWRKQFRLGRETL